MSRYIGAATVLCVFLFMIGCVAVFSYQLIWVAPGERCEKAGRWWLDDMRVCGIPIEISKITGRPNPPAPVTGQPVAAAPAPIAATASAAEAAASTPAAPKG